MYVLVITLGVGGGLVPGFASLEDCEAAGERAQKAYESMISKGDFMRGYPTFGYFCFEGPKERTGE